MYVHTVQQRNYCQMSHPLRPRQDARFPCQVCVSQKITLIHYRVRSWRWRILDVHRKRQNIITIFHLRTGSRENNNLNKFYFMLIIQMKMTSNHVLPTASKIFFVTTHTVYPFINKTAFPCQHLHIFCGIFSWLKAASIVNTTAVVLYCLTLYTSHRTLSAATHEYNESHAPPNKQPHI